MINSTQYAIANFINTVFQASYIVIFHTYATDKVRINSFKYLLKNIKTHNKIEYCRISVLEVITYQFYFQNQ